MDWFYFYYFRCTPCWPFAWSCTHSALTSPFTPCSRRRTTPKRWTKCLKVTCQNLKRRSILLVQSFWVLCHRRLTLWLASTLGRCTKNRCDFRWTFSWMKSSSSCCCRPSGTFFVFLTPPALPGVPVIWFHVRRAYSRSSFTFKRKRHYKHRL